MPVYKVRSVLVSFSERFAQATNLLLILALMGLTLGVVWLFLQDVTHLIEGNVERGVISALGSMPSLWLMIESLMNTEISHLKGGKFHISIFVGVAGGDHDPGNDDRHPQPREARVHLLPLSRPSWSSGSSTGS